MRNRSVAALGVVASLIGLLTLVPQARGQAAAASAGAHASGYHVAQKWNLGGEGGWDYLLADGDSHRLYLSRGDRVVVVDTESGKPAGEITGLSGVHGVAIAPELGRGFISNGRSSTVTIFDLKTLKANEQVKVTGENPDCILYDPASKRVFAFNGRTNNATVIEAASGKVVGTVALGGRPEFAAADGKGKVFVNIEDKSEVVQIDAATAAATARWPLTGCEEPSAMAIDRAHQRLVVGCGNKKMAVVDSTSGKVVTTVPIGEGVDAAGFDAATQLAFTSNGEGTLTVVHEDTPDKWTVVENVPTQTGARTMALDEKSHTVYSVTAQFGPRPAATKEQPRPRPPMVPNSFVVLVVSR
jgi:DNA-binding beta-propeller fold protein YncE